MELQLRLTTAEIPPDRNDATRDEALRAQVERDEAARNAADQAAAQRDDADLVHRARTDRQAFALLYRRHYAVIASYILRRVGDVHLTEDLTAETFLAVLKYLPRYRDRGLPIRAWLYRIAANTVNRWVRRERKRIAQSLADWQSANEPSGIAAESAGGVTKRTNGGSTMSAGESVPSLRHDDGRNDGEYARIALLSLPPKFQAVLTLHYLEGLSLEEVAAALGCRPGTVKSRLSRGRDALREKFSRRA